MQEQDSLTDQRKTVDVIAILASRGWLSLSQFGKLIGVTYPTVFKMRKEGKVIATRVGGVWRVYTDEIQRFQKHGNAKEEGEIPSSTFPLEI